MKRLLLGPPLAVAFFALVAMSACGPSQTAETSTTVPAATMATGTAATETSVPETTRKTVRPTSTMPSAEAPEGSARYLLTFEANWSAVTHPADFPSNPHFSGLIGAAHSEDVSLWAVGAMATPGIKNMAETGQKSPLDTEIEAAIARGEACKLISGGGIPASPGEVTVELTVNEDCPLVTVVSMIAPSPDWFVGVSGLPMHGDGGWVEELVVELYPYDAGTDSGLTYASPNEPTERRESIHEIESEPFAVGDDVPPLGVFRFTRLTE